jgi:amidase
MDPARVWEAWLVWRSFLVAAGLAPLLTDESKRDLMKPEALWEIDRGLALTAPQITNAAVERTAFHQAFVGLFDSFDVLAIPTAQVWPFAVEERWPKHIGDRPMDTYHRWMEVTSYSTFAGLPTISVPVGVDGRGLPMGMQLVGPPVGDVDVLRIAAIYENAVG